jgi:hypothetical protein
MHLIQQIISDHYIIVMIKMAAPALLIVGLCITVKYDVLKINNKNNIKCKTKKHHKNLY